MHVTKCSSSSVDAISLEHNGHLTPAVPIKEIVRFNAWTEVMWGMY